MLHEVEIRTSASRDIADAFAWYELQSFGLGSQFVLALDAALASVARNPSLFPIVYENQHRALLRRFPYAVFFIIEQHNRVVVTAVVHAKRDPDIWKQRK